MNAILSSSPRRLLRSVSSSARAFCQNRTQRDYRRVPAESAPSENATGTLEPVFPSCELVERPLAFLICRSGIADLEGEAREKQLAKDTFARKH